MATTPYTVTLTDGTIFANIATGTINTSSSMTLIGKNYAEYGQMLADNFIRLLENASNTTAPPSPITGQLWWDKTTTLLKVYSSTTGWKNVGGATASGSQPTPSIVGDLWFNTVNQQLYVCSVAGNPGTFIVVGAAVNNSGNITLAVANSVIETVASTGVYVTGVVSSSGNITGSNIVTAGLATVTGNVTGGNILTGGLISATGTVTGLSLLGSVVSASGNVTGGNVLTGGLVSATGTVTGSSVLSSVVSASGNVTGGNIVTGGFATVTGNIQGGNLITVGLISATGTVTGSQFTGSGAGLTSIPGGNVTGTVANATYAVSAGSATTATTAGSANSVAGANVSGTVANATYATSAGSATTATTATTANSANSILGTNVSGAVANATYATSAGSATTASIATTAGTANSVSGANVSGTVTNASFAATANSVSGANVSGVVANATYATSAGSATTAGTANSVSGANVSGAVANATYATSAGSATTAGTAGTVTTAAQGNITSVGTLTSLSVNGNVNVSSGRVVPFGIENTNWGWTSVVTSGTLYQINSNLGTAKRVYVFTGTSNQTIAMPLTTFNTVVPEYYFVNNSTGKLFIEDVVGFSIVTVPSGGDATVTGTFTSTPGASYWHASLGAANFISVTGTVTGSQFNGSGAGLTSIPGANVSGTVATATTATTAGTVTTAAQGNITSVGTLTSLSVSGTVTGGLISATGNVKSVLLVSNGIEFTNYGYANVATDGGSYSLPGGINNQKRVIVFTGSNTQTISTPLTTYNTVVPEYLIINKSTQALRLDDVIGFLITYIPPGATLTLTGVSFATLGSSNWRYSLAANNYALGCDGQTWQDVSGSRSLNTNYTNSTYRPIMVNVSVYTNVNQQMTLVVGGVTVAYTGWSSFGAGAVGGMVSAVVPPGVTYQAYTATGVGSATTWAELR